MRKIHFHLGIGFSTACHDEVVEFEDNATIEEINEEFEEWANEHEDRSWWEEECDARKI